MMPKSIKEIFSLHFITSCVWRHGGLVVSKNDSLQIKRSGFEPWQRELCYVLEHDTTSDKAQMNLNYKLREEKKSFFGDMNTLSFVLGMQNLSL